MSTNIVVDGCTLEMGAGKVVDGKFVGVDITGSVSISSAASSDTFINGKGVYFGDVTVVLASGASYEPGLKYITTAPASITIKPSGDNITDSSGNKVLLEGDSGSAEVVFANPTITSLTQKLTVTVTIKSAGQSDVLAL